MKTLLAVLTTALLSVSAYAAETSGFGLTVLVDEQIAPEYHARGTTYVEAMRGRPYSLRVTNPTPYRVAVALSVDGLNTIDAKHSDPRSAAKWILDPYESTVITGWQVSESVARQFFFTTEDRSYGAALGQTENLGVIEAVFYTERHAKLNVYAPRASKESAAQAQAPAPSEDYAATGMGAGTDNQVQLVDFNPEDHPAASIRIRYEFRPALVKLGVLRNSISPLNRREHAKGFENFCPVR